MAEKSINEVSIGFSGKASIAKNLELGEDVCFKVQGSVVSISDYDNQDGTYDKKVKVKIITAEPC